MEQWAQIRYLRGLAPRERVEKVIAVAHPEYRQLLEQYYERAKKNIVAEWSAPHPRG